MQPDCSEKRRSCARASPRTCLVRVRVRLRARVRLRLRGRGRVRVAQDVHEAVEPHAQRHALGKVNLGGHADGRTWARR